MKKIKNTKHKGVLHFRVFKWGNRYLGICKETGFVEEAETLEDARAKLHNGTVALLGAICKSSENLEPSLNTSPPFKYRIYYYFAPILGLLEFIKDSSKTDTGFYSDVESIQSLTPLKCNA